MKKYQSQVEIISAYANRFGYWGQALAKHRGDYNLSISEQARALGVPDVQLAELARQKIVATLPMIKSAERGNQRSGIDTGLLLAILSDYDLPARKLAVRNNETQPLLFEESEP